MTVSCLGKLSQATVCSETTRIPLPSVLFDSLSSLKLHPNRIDRYRQYRGAVRALQCDSRNFLFRDWQVLDWDTVELDPTHDFVAFRAFPADHIASLLISRWSLCKFFPLPR